MSDVSNPNNEDIDLNFDDIDIDSFFNDYNPENEETEASKENSKKEKIALFGGDLTDIEAFLKHEEIRLKFLEFKLKKTTLLREAHSTFKDRKNERRLRKENAKKAFWFSAIWAVFIGFFIMLHGLKCFKLPFLPFLPLIEYDFLISETEFMFVCGTLTASILIFYLTVIKNLFPNKLEEKSSSKNTENQSSSN